MRLRHSLPLLVAACAALGGCYGLRSSRGGAVTAFAGERRFDPAAVALPPGYVLEKVLGGLTYPTAVLFDDEDRVYVIESGYARGESWATPRLLRVEPDEDRFTVVAQGGKNGPWTGGDFYKGAFYIAEGGQLEGGRILRVGPDGRQLALLDGLPSTGDHPTNGPVVGPDGMLYFGQGTMTNAGVVGDDNAQFGWLDRYPDRHDIPCADVTLAGRNFPTKRGPTGAFSAYGTPTTAGQLVKGAVPCSGSILRLPPAGGKPELVAWGFRDPVGLSFSPDGKLYATDNGYDQRGSRPVWGAADFLWAVSTGAWYGWPDYSGEMPLGPRFKASGGAVLAKTPSKPPRPAAILASHSYSDGFDFSRRAQFGYVGDAFVAQFGDLSPLSGKVLAPVGFKIVRVSLETGAIEDFAVNKGKTNGPASLLGTGGLERPVAARFDRAGTALYVVDFGVVAMTDKGPVPYKGTGALWRIRRRD